MKKAILLIFLSLVFSCRDQNEGVEKIQTIPQKAEISLTEVDTVPVEEKQDSSLIEVISPSPPKEIESGHSENLLQNLSYELDTIKISSGNSIVDLKYGLSRSALSQDQTELRVFSPHSRVLDRFDLVNKKLISQNKFETEGPNGVAPMVSYLQGLADDRLLLAGYNSLGIFDLKGNKQKIFEIPIDAFPELSPYESETLMRSLRLDERRDRLYSLPRSRSQEKVSLAILDLNAMKGDLVLLPKFGPLVRMDLIFKEGISAAVFNSAEFSILLEQNRIFIYSAGMSGVYIYIPSNEKLTFKSINHQLVPNNQNVPELGELSTIEEFEKAYLNLLYQISYGEILYDDTRQIYFRFGEIGIEKGDPFVKTESDVFLFSYDKDFNLQGEARLVGLDQVPVDPFFKDGKLWSYVNVEDELGFAVYTFDF